VTANKNRAILEPLAIFDEILASWFFFYPLLLSDIKKPQPLDFPKTIVATLPEPTVLPPSRYFNSVFYGIFYAFYCENQHKIAVFIWYISIYMISWHRFGTNLFKILFITKTQVGSNTFFQ